LIGKSFKYRESFEPICATCGELIKMATISGKVTSKSRAGTGIQIDKKKWYNGDADLLAEVKWKDTVTVTTNAKGEIISVDKIETPEEAAPAGGGGYKSDPETQKKIEMQSARRDAITTVLGMVQNQVFVLPNDKAGKLDAVLNMIDLVTDRFFLREQPKANEDD